MALTLPNNFLMVNGITPANVGDYLQANYCNVDENESIADVMWGVNLDVSSVINNTFNAPNVLFPEYSEFAQFIFDLKLDRTYYFVFMWDEGDLTFAQRMMIYDSSNDKFVPLVDSGVYHSGTQLFEIAYPWYGDANYKYKYIQVVAVEGSNYFVYEQKPFGTDLYDKWYLKGILVGDQDSMYCELPFNHEISSTYTQNFNGTTFKAASGAITKYKLGRPEKQINWNYKIENITAFNRAAQIQSAQAETGLNLILKEQNKLYILDADPINITQEANLVWNVNISGTEKI